MEKANIKTEEKHYILEDGEFGVRCAFEGTLSEAKDYLTKDIENEEEIEKIKTCEDFDDLLMKNAFGDMNYFEVEKYQYDYVSEATRGDIFLRKDRYETEISNMNSNFETYYENGNIKEIGTYKAGKEVPLEKIKKPTRLTLAEQRKRGNQSNER